MGALALTTFRLPIPHSQFLSRRAWFRCAPHLPRIRTIHRRFPQVTQGRFVAIGLAAIPADAIIPPRSLSPLFDGTAPRKLDTGVAPSQEATVRLPGMDSNR